MSSPLIDTLLNDFNDKRWKAQPFERLVALLRSDPAQAAPFAEATLARLPSGGTFLDLALSFVPEDAFGELVGHAVEALASEAESGAAESVIAYGSLQFPALLRPHLARLFELCPNGGSYCEDWPWRAADPQDQAVLLDIIDRPGPDKERMKAWLCLLESRAPAALAAALDRAAALPLRHEARTYLHQVASDTPTSRLAHPAVWHLVFDPACLAQDRPAWMDPSLHPSWSLPDDGATACRFGGASTGGCGLCGGPLHHLVTLPGHQPALSPTQNDPVELAVCLSCLGWEKPVLAYSHRDRGRPQSLDHGDVVPEFKGEAFRETTVRLTATPARWHWQDWGLSNGRENLNRVGGEPSWVQSARYPDCPGCDRTMPFLLQLDSNLPTASGGEWLWGSGGMAYGFWCPSCQVSAFTWQCT